MPDRFAPLGLLLGRVLMGAFFLYEATSQLAKGWIGGDGLTNTLATALRDNSMPPPYRYFLEHLVLPHADSATLLVVPGEIAVGLALVLGIATRVTALSALLMNVNFFLMNGAITPGALIDALFVILEAVLIAFAAKQALSVDGALAHRGISSWWLSGGSPPRAPVDRH